jgi:hypothetical protein
MDREKPIWCNKCFRRIAPYDLRTVYQGVDYHQSCFLKLVREQADEERRGAERDPIEQRSQYTRVR